jgi:copper chaperone
MVELTVTGMTCGGCARAVTNAVKSVDAAAGVVVDVAGKRVSIDSQADLAEIKAAIEDAGYNVDRQPA